MGRKAEPGKRQRIVAAAAEVFASKGYNNTKIIEIAETAGIGKGTVYEYFQSKEALFFAVFQSMFDIPLSKIAQTSENPSNTVAGRIRATVDDIVQDGLSRLAYYSLVMEFWSATTALLSRKQYRDVFKKKYKQLRNLCAELIQQGIDNQEFSPHVQAQQVSAAIVGAVDALLLQAWLDPEFDPAAVSSTFIDVMLSGLKTFKKEN